MTSEPQSPPAPRTRVLIMTGDLIRARMAGPAIRVWNMATVLSAHCDVRIVSWSRIERTSEDFELHFVHERDDAAMGAHEEWADVIIVQGTAFRVFPSIARTDKVVVADLYDPFHLEQLEQNKHADPTEWEEEVAKAVSLLNEQLLRADCVLCASERQRDLWFGALSALGRINPLTYTADPTFESIVRIVPFGLPAEAPTQTRHALKGTVPGIAADDKVLIWGGGIYEWFDPVTLVRAMKLVVAERPETKLFFLSARHFNPDVPEMKVLGDTLEVSDELELTDRHVFFNDSWVDYEDRVNFLLDADAGVSTHPIHLETRFSFRTRILDYLWARLPIIATDGDSFADIVRAHRLGAVVPPEDPRALADAILAVLYDDEVRARAIAGLERVRVDFAWEQALQPLVDFCTTPRRAADRGATGARPGSGQEAFGRILEMPKGPRRDLSLFLYYLRSGGWSRVRAKLEDRRERLSRR
ncbi:glycosyltransferase family 4 protein [Microbacterium sp. SSM24]|uniref:glycosyltransferase family 4 protein n=1 Tax=Microbacterium sp. SSM24 TaxID=2991714 RepID=UPI0022263599|nr:glycosyltransferase family 4 protein [Microbacterium sp. SSM24]MCW3493753.1 glycosyltransferase family 4 protein [Microbacterium sp. SSM24]